MKGMYVETLLSMLKRRGAALPTDKRYFSFKDYPLRELMRLMVDALEVLYPDISPREAMIALGRLAFPTFTSTTIGKVIFSVAGNSWVRALSLHPPWYGFRNGDDRNWRAGRAARDLEFRQLVSRRCVRRRDEALWRTRPRAGRQRRTTLRRRSDHALGTLSAEPKRARRGRAALRGRGSLGYGSRSVRVITRVMSKSLAARCSCRANAT